MVAQPKTIEIEPESQLGTFLEQMTNLPVILVSNGRRFRLAPDPEDILAGYDPEKVRAAFERAHGLLAGVDVEALKAELREQRGHDRRDRQE